MIVVAKMQVEYNCLMKIVVGLGNSEEKYAKTRHNVGFVVVDELFRKLDGDENVFFRKEKKFEAEVVRVEEVMLVKPLTFVNESGRAVRKVVDYYKVDLDSVYVVHDDLDIVLGKYKIEKGRGPKIHKGVLSVEKYLKNKKFWRVRVGIDGRAGKRDILGEDYVLGKFLKEEKVVIEKVVKTVVAELASVLK